MPDFRHQLVSHTLLNFAPDLTAHIMDAVSTLQAMGLVLPTPAYIVGVLLFSVVGIFAYYRGKRSGDARTKWLGVALMLYPYAVSDTGLLYGVGAVFTIAVFVLNRPHQ